MSYPELDKTQGLSIWHVEDYLDLIWKHRGDVKWQPMDIPGIDYVPYENVLPNASLFSKEYAALPAGRRIALKGELLKEAKSWALPAEWADKTEFVAAVRRCCQMTATIQARANRLREAIEEIRNRLRTPDNYRTINAFVEQNRRDVERNTQALQRARFREGSSFLPEVRLAPPPKESPGHYPLIRPKTYPDPVDTSICLRRSTERATKYSTETVDLDVTVRRDVCLGMARPKSGARHSGVLHSLRRFLFGA